MQNQHKPRCKINTICDVDHQGRPCPRSYGMCDCGVDSVAPKERKECTAFTKHDDWCGCGKDSCWEEQLRVRVGFDKNPDREVCILFIHRLLKEGRQAALKEVREWVDKNYLKEVSATFVRDFVVFLDNLSK